MELVRRSIRAAIGSDSVIYRAGSRALDFSLVAMREGPAMARLLRRLSLETLGQPRAVRFRNLRHAISIRPGTPDAKTAINSFVREDYGFIRPARTPVSMIDAGAYIGDTSAYFLSKYASLRVAALEPDADNFAMARINLAPYGDAALLLNKALSSRNGTVLMAGEYDGACIADSGVEVEAVTVPAVMSRMGWDRLDILKLDIEGAEEQVLDDTSQGWLGRVRLIIVEVHGAAADRAVRRMLERNNFSVRQYRGCWYCQRQGDG